MTTLFRVQDILSEQLGFTRIELSPEALFTDLNADSLDMVEIVMFVESEFDIDISDAQADTLTTISSLVDLITSQQ